MKTNRIGLLDKIALHKREHDIYESVRLFTIAKRRFHDAKTDWQRECERIDNSYADGKIGMIERLQMIHALGPVRLNLNNTWPKEKELAVDQAVMMYQIAYEQLRDVQHTTARTRALRIRRYAEQDACRKQLGLS